MDQPEKFEIFPAGPKPNYIALRAANNFYVSVANDGSLIANGSRIGPSETFEKVNHSDGTQSLKSITNTQFVCADMHKNSSLIANRSYADKWERFEFVQQW